MKCIKKDVENEITINKSKFITILTKVNNQNEIKEKLELYKKTYKDATHQCYGYIINGKEKCSDDKEPSGTAGMPILNVLKNNNLNYILCIVIRYFGGVKLGAGGLVRAYSKSVTSALEKTEIATLIDGYKIILEFDYEQIKAIDNLLKNYQINKHFDEKIVYELEISVSEYEKISSILNEKAKLISKEPILLTV